MMLCPLIPLCLALVSLVTRVSVEAIPILMP